MSNFRSTLFSLSALCGAALLGFISAPSLAQDSSGVAPLAPSGAIDLQPWEGGGQTDAATNANNPLSGRNGTGASSLFELLNRIQSIQSQSGADFARNQDKNFNKAVEAFQKQQEAAIEAEPEE